MNANKLSLIPFFLMAIFFMFQCKESVQDPQILTLEPVVTNNTSVTLGLRINVPLGSIKEYGFVWDGLPQPDNLNNTIKFFDPLSSSVFEAELQQLELEQTYYVRAYYKSNSTIIYGNEKSFVFGGKTPEIKKISPFSGYWGDTVNIIGKNFPAKADQIEIKFNDLLSTIIQTSADTVVCIVPQLLSLSQKVSVKVGDNTSNIEMFTLLEPEIISFTPTSATFLEEVTINGKFFHNSSSRNKVRFGSKIAEIVHSTATSLVVRVPVNMNLSSVPLSVQIDSQKVISLDKFSLLPFSVSSLEPTAADIGDILTILGENFNPEKENNEVFFENNKAEVIEASAYQLKVKVPNGSYNKRNFNVSLKIAGINKNISPFTISNAWLRKSDIEAGEYGRWGAEGFVINGIGYVGLGGGAGASSAYQDFYKFDEQTNSWIRVADYGGGRRYWTVSFVINNIAYVGTGSELMSGEGLNDFYKYESENNTWTRIADFPGVPINSAVGFSFNGKGYVCLPTDTDNFWVYDPIVNSWTKKATLITSNLGGGKTVDGAFVLNKRAFIVATRYSSGKLYEYDFISDQWTRKNDLPYGLAGNLPTVISTESKAYYFVDYSAMEYNIENDAWISVDFDAISTRNDAFHFSIGERIFIGGGRENNYKDFWECETSLLY